MAEREHTFNALVLTPEGQIFDGEAEQVSTRTRVGEIGILANHVPMLARLDPTVLRIHVPGEDVRRWAQAEGWLQVFANQVMILVSEAIEPDRLDPGELRSRVEDAERRLEETEEDSAARGQAERDKQRAEAFLAVAEGD